MEEKLTLSDGTEIRGHISPGTGRIFLYLFEITLSSAFEKLSNPECVQEIQENVRGKENIYRGYTHLRAISEEMDGMMICADMLSE